MGKDSLENEYGLSKRAAFGLLFGGSLVVLLIGLAVGSYYTTGEMPGFGGPSSKRAGAAPPESLPPPAWEPASPTPEQAAALRGGKAVTWEKQAMRFTVPADFSEAQVTDVSFWYQNTDGSIALVASANPLGYAVQPEAHLESLYSQQRPRLKSGTYDDLRYLEVDGVKGVVWRERPTDGQRTPRRLQWTAFRKHDGESQSIGVTITAPGDVFKKNEDLIYAILYSAKIAQ